MNYAETAVCAVTNNDSTCPPLISLRSENNATITAIHVLMDLNIWCPDSSVGIETMLLAERSRGSIPRGVQNGFGSHTASYTFLMVGAICLGVEWPEHETDHSSPSSAEYKDIYTSTPS
jgi:hypothetical protein